MNHWLSRQIYYHGETNRLSTDPQTRNYLQDNMGMGYIKPNITRNAFITALSQQEFSGSMPDGILIEEGAPFWLHQYMPLRHFNAITSAVPHTNKPHPAFLDHFHKVQQMLDAFNKLQTGVHPVLAQLSQQVYELVPRQVLSGVYVCTPETSPSWKWVPFNWRWRWWKTHHVENQTPGGEGSP